MNQSYVIATQTKVDISKVTMADEINDEYFTEEGKTADIFQDSDKVSVGVIVFLSSPFFCRSTQSVMINARQIRRKSMIKCCLTSTLWAEIFKVINSTLIMVF